MGFGRRWKNWGGLGSMMRYCMFYKAQNGKWYMELAPFEHGDWEDADTYGPFPSLDAADAFLRDNFSNPGGDDVDDSGTREVPTRSPNGGPVIDPRKQRRGWFGFGDAAADRRAEVGKIIFEQFGGGRAMAMLGGQATLLNTPNYGEGGLGIKWPNKQRSKGNYVEIILRPDDTYDMTFYNLTIRAKKPVKTYKGVYAEDLRRLFEDQTGWRLSLGPMHGLGDSRRNQWLVVAFFPWGEGRAILASLATRREAREYAAWERRHPGTPRETTIRVMHEDAWKQMVEEEEYNAGLR